MKPVETPAAETPAPTPWPEPDELKRRVDRVNFQFAKIASLYDVAFDALKLGLLITAVGWVIAERSGLPTPWLGFAGGCIAGSWVSMKTFPHILHLCELEHATSEKLLWSRLWRSVLITSLFGLLVTLPLALGIWVGIEQLKQL